MGPIAGKKSGEGFPSPLRHKLDSGALLAFNLIQRRLAGNDLTARQYHQRAVVIAIAADDRANH